MDIEIEQKDNKIELLKKEIGLPDSKVTEEMKRLGVNKIWSKGKGDRIMDRLNKSLNKHKYNKKEKAKKN